MVTLVVGLIYLTLLIPKLTGGCDLDFVYVCVCECLCMHACSHMHACIYIGVYDVHTHTHTITKYIGCLVVKCVVMFARGRVWLSFSVLCFVFSFMHVFRK